MGQTQTEKSTSASCMCKYNANMMRKLRRLFHTFCWILDWIPSHWLNKNSTKFIAQSISLEPGHKLIPLHWMDSVLKFLKYNLGIQQICSFIKLNAFEYTHKLAERNKGRWRNPNGYSLCVFTGSSLCLGWHGDMELQYLPLPHCQTQHGVFSSSRMQQKRQCGNDRRDSLDPK